MQGTRWRIDDGGRECSACGIYQPWENFSRHYGQPRGYPRGRSSRCRTCRQAENREYRRVAGRALKVKRGRYYQQHRAEGVASARAWRQQNRDRAHAYQRAHDQTIRRRVIEIMCPIIVEEVARAFSALVNPVTVEEILGRGREPHIAWPRLVVYTLMRDVLRLDPVAIGAHMGRDQSSIRHGQERVTRERRLARQTPTTERTRFLDAVRHAEQAVRHRRANERHVPKRFRGARTEPTTARVDPMGDLGNPLVIYSRKRALRRAREVSYAS